MINAYDLPTPADGERPIPMTVPFQLRRLNRIASVLWEARERIGDDPAIRIALDLDSGYTQIHFNIHRGGRLVAEQLAARLGWDVEADVKRAGMTRQHWWFGMVGGFRAQLVWIEEAEPVDTQGRDQLPADVGIGDAAADAAHVRLQEIAASGAADGLGVRFATVAPAIARSVVPFCTEGPGQ